MLRGSDQASSSFPSGTELEMAVCGCLQFRLGLPVDLSPPEEGDIWIYVDRYDYPKRGGNLLIHAFRIPKINPEKYQLPTQHRCGTKFRPNSVDALDCHRRFDCPDHCVFRNGIELYPPRPTSRLVRLNDFTIRQIRYTTHSLIPL